MPPQTTDMSTLTCLQWARRSTAIVHISQVESGAACGCICDKCGQALIAKKGIKRVHHFAHVNSDCHGNQESLMHQMAKDIIAREKSLVMPGRAKNATVAFDIIDVEKRIGPYCADLVGLKDGRRCIVEIAVTHRCERDKVQYLRSEGLAALEIYIDARREYMSVDEYAQHVMADAARRWISNPKLEPATSPGNDSVALVRTRGLFNDRDKLESGFLRTLRRAVGDRPNRLHYGTLEEMDLRNRGVRWRRTVCVKSPELPSEFDNTAMVMWSRGTLKKYLGRRVGFDVVYDYDSSVVLDAGILFPQVVVRWVEGVDQWDLTCEIGSRKWRRKSYSWI